MNLQACEDGQFTASIPSIDFGPFMMNEGVLIGKDATATQKEVGQKMNHICRSHGFLHITNFSLTPDLHRRVFLAAKEIFDLPLEYKLQRLNRIDPSTNVGYSPMKSESLHRHRPPELKEAFNVNFENIENNASLDGCPAAFKKVVHELRMILKEAARRFALACAVALDIPEARFFEKTLDTMSLCRIRFLHAPPCDFDECRSAEHDMSKSVLVAEHTDFGAFTFLLHDNDGTEGLQIRMPTTSSQQGGECNEAIDERDSSKESAEWMDVVLPRSAESQVAAIINTGALMARWTNDEWKATPHRVIVKSANMANRHRYSVACFITPDTDSLIEIHDSFLSNNDKEHLDFEKPTKNVYEPIKSQDYILLKLQEMMSPGPS